MTNIEIYNKAVKVLESCSTVNHYLAARKYIDLAKKSIKNDTDCLWKTKLLILRSKISRKLLKARIEENPNVWKFNR